MYDGITFKSIRVAVMTDSPRMSRCKYAKVAYCKAM